MYTVLQKHIPRVLAIKKYHPHWKSIYHFSAEYGLAICYNTKKVLVVKEFSEISSIELFPLLMNMDGEIILIILIYVPLGGQRDVFMYQLLQELSIIEETRYHWIILCDDFNIDHMLQENVNAFQRLLQERLKLVKIRNE